MPTSASRIAAATCIAGALAALAAAGVAAGAQHAQVTRVTCGPFDAVPSGAGESGRPTRLSIQRDGRLLQTVSDWWITRVDCVDLGNDKTLELLVASDSGGAHCCETLRMWSLEPKAPRKILEYEAGNAGGFELRDLDGSGRQELLLGDDSFAYFDDLSYAVAPNALPLVACLTDAGFQDCTTRFPEVLRESKARYAQRLQGFAVGADVKQAEGAALGVLALSVLLGEEEAGLDAVRRTVASDEIMQWLERACPKVREWARTRSRKLNGGRR
jgi:hypothetical protein